jgi:hypothetical protein
MTQLSGACNAEKQKRKQSLANAKYYADDDEERERWLSKAE